VYVPTTLGVLAGYHAAGEVVDVVRLTAEDESEEAEYDALLAAAELSEAMLTGPGRRVVLVGEGSVAPDEPIPFDRIEAVHVDTEDIDPGADDLPELAWYAVQEIPALLHP
jgi:hypothetical protein